MAKISRNGKGKTLYIEISVYPCGNANPKTNLTISCPNADTRFKTTLSDKGLKKFRANILDFYTKNVLDNGP
jgi:hypothetical protein